MMERALESHDDRARPHAGARRAQAPVRQMSTLKTLYSTVFRSNITYLTYVFVGAIALDTVYSKGVDTAWEIANSGVSAGC